MMNREFFLHAYFRLLYTCERVLFITRLNNTNDNHSFLSSLVISFNFNQKSLPLSALLMIVDQENSRFSFTLSPLFLKPRGVDCCLPNDGKLITSLNWTEWSIVSNIRYFIFGGELEWRKVNESNGTVHFSNEYKNNCRNKSEKLQ